MSKLNTKEFAAAIGSKPSTIRGHIGRKKLVRDSEGYIDTELEKNRLYIKQHTKGKGIFTSTPKVPAKKVPSDELDKSQQEIVFHDKRTPEQKRRDKLDEDLDLRKKTADLNKAEHDAELKRLEIEKKAGRLLPIELVQKIMTINIQVIFKNFDSESDRIAGIFTEVFGGGRSELADITKRMRESLAVAISKAKEDSLFEIEQAIDEYSEVRSRGERK